MPDHFELERELWEQLSGRPGHQRCVVGHDELLLILHDFPQAGIPERDAVFFWRRMDGHWIQAGGLGLNELGALLERYATAIDANEEILEKAERAAEIFQILRQAGPMCRTLRNTLYALEKTQVQVHEDREIRSYLDRTRELVRAAELLQIDAKETMLFLQAETAENHAESSERLGNILFKLNLVTGFFLPVVALGAIFGMNVRMPGFVEGMFWWILLLGLLVGGLLLWYVSRERE